MSNNSNAANKMQQRLKNLERCFNAGTNDEQSTSIQSANGRPARPRTSRPALMDSSLTYSGLSDANVATTLTNNNTNTPSSLANLAHIVGLTGPPLNNQRSATNDSIRDQPFPSAQALRISANNNNTNVNRTHSNWQRQQSQPYHANNSRHASSNLDNGNSFVDMLSSLPHIQPSYDIASSELANRFIDDQSRKTQTNGPNSLRNILLMNNRSIDEPNNLEESYIQPSEVYGPTTSNSIILNGNVQLIPVSGQSKSYTEKVPPPRMVPANRVVLDDLDPLPSLGHNPETPIDESALLQLMAVLSNPALTLTPIDTPETATYTPNVKGVRTSSNIDITTSQNSQSKKTKSKPKTKNNSQIPKSAANLQMIYADAPSDNEINKTNVDLSGSFDIQRDEMDGFDDVDIADPIHIISCEEHVSQSGEVVDLPVTGIDDPTQTRRLDIISDSVRHLVMNTGSNKSSTLPTVSVNLLKKIAGQTDKNLSIRESRRKQIADKRDRSLYEPDCILRVPRKSLQNFDVAVKIPKVEEIVYVNEDAIKVKSVPRLIKTTTSRLFVPTKTPKATKRHANHPVLIEKLETDAFAFLSDRHEMLESQRPTKRRKIQLESDIIPVMPPPSLSYSDGSFSRISSVIQRRKIAESRPADQISDLSNYQDELDFDYLGCLEFCDPDESSKILNVPDTIDVQLPLEIGVDAQRDDFMTGLGLVTRYQRNKLLAHQCEQKLRCFSALSFESPEEVSPELTRFVDMIDQTGGTDIQLRIESNIKRSDLPLIEGLNRNTSRHKLTYMSVLDLDKRSKRTTLYKVGRQTDQSMQEAPTATQKISLPPIKQKPNNDLISQAKANHIRKTSKSSELSKSESNIIPILLGIASAPRAPVSSIALSCREAMNSPSKQDYMKSLGLISP